MGLISSGLWAKSNCVFIPEPQHADPRKSKVSKLPVVQSPQDRKGNGPRKDEVLACSTRGVRPALAWALQAWLHPVLLFLGRVLSGCILGCVVVYFFASL